MVGRRRLFPFCKRSMPFLKVDATIGNQTFSHDGCEIFPRLNYNKANNMFLNSFRIFVNFKERARATCH